MDVQRRVFQLFGRSATGVTVPIFKHHMHQSFGVVLSDAEAAALFARYDREGRGCVSLPDFTRRLLPPDYTAEQWNVARARTIEATLLKEGANAGHVEPTLDKWPAAYEAVRPSIDGFREQLARLIIQRVRRPEDQYREAYHMLGAPSSGIMYEDFRFRMKQLGLVMTDEECRQFFNSLDTDGSGNIDFSELVARVMPPDYTSETWVQRRGRELAAKVDAHELVAPVLTNMPASLKAVPTSLDDLTASLAEKIMARCRRPEDQFRTAYRMFGAPHEGVTEPQLGERMRGLGLVVTDAQVHDLFKAIDTDGSGHIDFRELITAVFPKDYTEVPWAVRRVDEDFARSEYKKEHHESRTLDAWPKSLQHAKLSRSEVERLIQDKIMERTRRPSDQYREAYRMFGSPHDGIRREELRSKVRAMGLVLDDDEIDQLFDSYDHNSNDRLEFSELVKHVMPPDYDRKPWNVERDEKEEAKRAAQHAEFAAESPFGLDKIPGWHGLNSFGIPRPVTTVHAAGAKASGARGDRRPHSSGPGPRRGVMPASSKPVRSVVDLDALEELARRQAGLPPRAPPERLRGAAAAASLPGATFKSATRAKTRTLRGIPTTGMLNMAALTARADGSGGARPRAPSMPRLGRGAKRMAPNTLGRPLDIPL